MKETANKAYPYPECAPPLVKDAGDLPLQLKALAVAINDDVAALQTQVASALNPPSASVSSASAPVNPVLGTFILTTTDYDNSGIANPGAGRIDIPGDGLYCIVAFRSYSQSATEGTQLNVRINTGIVETSSIHPGVSNVVRNTMTSVQFLRAGDQVYLSGVEPLNTTNGPTQLQVFRIAVA